MNISELRGKSIDELNAVLNSLSVSFVELSLKKASGELDKPHLIKETRRNIARVKTLISESSES